MDGHQLPSVIVKEAQAVFLVGKSWLSTFCKLKLHKRAMTSVGSELEIRKSPCRSNLSFPKCITWKNHLFLLSLEFISSAA